MTLQKRFYVSSNVVAINKGNVVPAWNGNYNKANWWYDGSENTSYFYSSYGDSTYIQYGQNLGTVPWASARFFGETVAITNEVENDDGSITATVSVTPNFFAGRNTDYSAPTGFAVQYRIRINNQLVYSFDGSTIDEITQGAVAPVTFNVRVEPEKESTASAMSIGITYPNGEYPNSNTTVGVALFNPTPPTYKPNGVNIGGSFKKINQTNGFNSVRVNNVTTDISNESIATIGQDAGSNRVRISNTTKQAYPYNDNGTIGG